MARYSRLGYVALNVTDIERSVDFYERLLGLQLVGRGKSGEAYFRCSNDHHNVVLYPAPTAGLKRAGFLMESEADLSALRRRVEGAGLVARDVDPAECANLYQGPTFRVSEPHSGTILEFYAATQLFEHALFTPTVAKIERLGHVVVRSPDLEKSPAVAQEAFNFRCSDTIVGLAHFLRCYPNQFHHSLAFTRGERSGLNHVNFMVTEIDEGFGEMTRVDALSADMWLAPIGQVGDAQRPVGVKRGPHKDVSLSVDNHHRSGRTSCGTPSERSRRAVSRSRHLVDRTAVRRRVRVAVRRTRPSGHNHF